MPFSAKILRPVLAVAVAFSMISTAAADPWPRFRGPNGNGVVPACDIPSQFSEKSGILWKFPLPGFGNSSPVVWDNLLFLQTASKDAKERSLVCIDIKGTPKVLWKKSIPGVYVKFRGESSHASSTPAVDGENVYTVFWDGHNLHLHAFSIKGDPLWNHDLGEFVSQHGPGASPILHKDKLYFANDMDKKSTLLCYDKKTGRKVWEKEREAFRACYSAPYLLEGTNGKPEELIVTSTSAITSYHPDSGDINWSWAWDWQVTKKGKDFPLRTVCSSHLVNGMIFAGSGDGGGDRYAIGINLNGAGKGARPAKLWDNRKDFPYVPCMLSRGDHLYFVNDAGLAGCYEARSGKRLWLERVTDAKIASSPILVGDRVFGVGETGDVFCFAADPTFKLLGRSELGQLVRASPAVADGKLYIRGNTHLFCIGK